MRTVKRAGIVAALVICLLLVICGCQQDRTTTPAAKVEPPADAPAVTEPQENTLSPAIVAPPEGQVASPEPNEAGPPVDLSLTFAPGQTAVYRVTTEAEKSVEWMGPASARPAGHMDGRSGNYVEMTFEQRVQEVRADGNAVVEVTIQDLKYLNRDPDGVRLDFDSRRAEDRGNPLAALIGKSYRLELSARGEMVALVDMASVRRAVRVGSPEYGVAVKLFSEEIVRDRHAIPPLSALEAGGARPGQHWSDLKPFSFGQMGFKSYERVYTLKPVGQDDGRTAIMEMKAIPSAAMAQEMHKRQTARPPSSLFDNTEQYEGRLELDLDAGRVRAYDEQMQIEWVFVDPASAQGTTQPLALKMGARRLHRLELVQP